MTLEQIILLCSFCSRIKDQRTLDINPTNIRRYNPRFNELLHFDIQSTILQIIVDEIEVTQAARGSRNKHALKQPHCNCNLQFTSRWLPHLGEHVEQQNRA